jgi:hypothetical protein
MTGMNTGPVRPPRPAAENDIYTALLGVAFLSLLAAAIYVSYRGLTLFGTLLPPGGAS